MVRPHYGPSYNEGGVPAGGFGYLGRGHWANRDRWTASAEGIYQAVAQWGNPHGLVLDLGCGRGELTSQLHRVGLVAVGIDITDDRTPPGPTVQASALNLPLADGQVATVLALDILEHVPPELQAQLWAGLWRVMAPRGLVLATVPVVDEDLVRSIEDGPFNHYLELREERWRQVFEAQPFDLVASGPQLERLGLPFNLGRGNHPFALRRR